MEKFSGKVGFIWSIADLLRGDYEQSEYGRVVLPFTVLRRLDCVLEQTKNAVLDRFDNLPVNIDGEMREKMLNMASGQSFHNISGYTLTKLLSDPDNIASNLNHFINGFSRDARDIFIEYFDFSKQLDKLDKANLLYLIVSKFKEIDLHPDQVSHIEMCP